MRCPFCGSMDTRVLDSRPTLDGAAIRRRRECISCGRRFTTYERYEEAPVLVIKKDGRREKFDRNKIKNGMIKACEKRPVTYDQIEEAVNRICLKLREEGLFEVETKKIGELVMEELKKLDQVAYVRFASVYRDFREVDQFLEIVKELKREKEGEGK
ncbi:MULTISPECIES: transcriptional regulator NrdR [Thermotoga]|uniref:Transcriptional repressor NrdR n=1 Tax=Thermotoga neapolitana (strain ATCC 49049 / DSM 4359 / NBRC 107923 / NS-E) TaxID=309803 RepID=NRDR_THENN|nr:MULTISPECIES: transcriptional regulator NrdR [Thermotoga]B9K7Y8.1 RecName: Full=Transcriptional repressor NrdR [Thermotoga neapolitana DSM 4359]MDK2786087.1 transcriptional repressor NrdR [Thermotoga sp.]HBF11648.1 transcriptional regulator NrdR [Thermotoga neapolitana]ACM23071.1 Transcriptional repressor nrdR [Thermotoga neapolitana DSM 4359]AJG40986.1 NrdR family transcriptional regulator [Thermotoga sp. RQ7]KFZ21882.1 transcriptional regulator NrdR [Thermotoga neapolitana LA10]